MWTCSIVKILKGKFKKSVEFQMNKAGHLCNLYVSYDEE